MVRISGRVYFNELLLEQWLNHRRIPATIHSVTPQSSTVIIYFTFCRSWMRPIQSLDWASHDFFMTLQPVVTLVLKAPQHSWQTSDIQLGFTVCKLLSLQI